MAVVRIAERQNASKEMAPKYLRVDAEQNRLLDTQIPIQNPNRSSTPMAQCMNALRPMIPKHLIIQPKRLSVFFLHPYRVQPRPLGKNYTTSSPRSTDHYAILPQDLPPAVACRVVSRTTKSHNVHAGFMSPGKHLPYHTKASKMTS